MTNDINLTALFIILAVAIGTYCLKVSGLLLSSKFKKSYKINVFLETLPATLLISLILPSIIKEGLIGIVASLLVVLCMYKTNNILLSMILGMLLVAIGRAI